MGGNAKLADFMPFTNDDEPEEATMGDVMGLLSGGRK